MRLSLSVKYAVSTALILVSVVGPLLFLVSLRHEKLVIAQTEMQAKALFQQIVITRRWIADHGGVFVEKLPWVRENPYLSPSTITDEDGKRYVKQNPALVTRQLSAYAQKEGLFFFRITSLKLMNPENAPDEFEAAALKRFEKKESSEASTIEKIGAFHYFRYSAPLFIEQACLDCHAAQGYRVGDVRGAVSVSVPMEGVLRTISRDRTYLVVGGGAAAVLLMLSLFVMTRRMVIKPITTLRSLMRKFSTDGDPHLPLLRTGDELEDLNTSFREMAKAIDEYHACLQEKIRTATRELMETNEALVNASRSKSDFIAKTSHELRTPLTAIKGAMDYLSAKLSVRKGEEDQELIVFFEMIRKSADRLIRLVNNILEYERIGLGAVEMHFTEMNLKEGFQEVVTGFEPLAAAKNVTIRMQAMDVTMRADEDRMKQVLTNLLSNALSFSPESATIWVTLQSRGDQVYVAVEDMGIRIPQDERENIFKQYYTRNVSGGTGLGLAICKGIIEAHGGEIGVADSALGGSCFWFTVPREGRETKEYEKTAACDR